MPPLRAVEPERPEAVQAEADPLRLRGHASLARARRELEEALESGGEPRDAASGQFVGDPRLQGEPPCPVLGAQASHVAVVVVRVDEAGEGRLVQHVGRPAGAAALRGERAGEPLGDDPPREADGRREALRGRPGVQHVVGRERLECADRAAVVAELAVVVVLDDEAAGAFRPAHDLEPPRGAERHADRELVRRGEQHRIHVPEPLDHRAAGVDGDGDRREARGADDLAVRLVPDLLDGDPPRPGRRERAAREPQELAEPSGDDGALHRRDDAAHPAEVVAQRRPERREPRSGG